MDKYLIINLGLKSIRVIVFSNEGEQIFAKSRPVNSKLYADRVEQSVLEWKEHLNDLLGEIKDAGLSSQIKYITATTSSSCIYGMDKSNNPVTPVMMVSDKRSKVQSDKIVKSEIYNTKQLKFGYQCSSSSIVPKMLWYKEVQSEVFSNVNYWCGAGEFISNFLTGDVFTDSLSASKAFYNGVKYDEDILNSFGLDVRTLPRVEEIGYSKEISKGVAKEYDISESARFVLTTYDAICAVIGSTDGTEGIACDVSGTVTSVRTLTKEFASEKGNLPVLKQNLGMEDYMLVGASNNLGGGIIEWYKQTFYPYDSTNVYSEMESDAMSSSVGANGIIFLPHLLGERAPFVSSSAKGTFFGISRKSNRQDFTRAVLESSAMVSRDLLEMITSSEIQINELAVSGGLARFDLVNQIKADVTGLPVRVIDNFESTAVGSFILLGVGVGLFKSIEEGCSLSVKIRKIIYPNSRNHSEYEKQYSLYKELTETLLPLYDKHLQVLSERKDYNINNLKNL